VINYMNVFNSLGEKSVEQLSLEALNFAKHASNVERRENIHRRIDYMNGIQLPYLEKLISKQFSDPSRLRLQLEYFNLTEMIISELATLYSESPSRELVDATETDQKIYEEIVETSQINTVMSTVNKFSKLCKTVAVMPVFRDGALELDILTPDMFDVVQDPINPTRANAIIYTLSSHDTNPLLNVNGWGTGNQGNQFDPMQLIGQVYVYWDKSKSVVFSYDIRNNQYIPKIKMQHGNENNINPFGVLPTVFIRDRFPVDQFFIEGGDDLINANEILNVKLTELNYLTKMQAFSQPVAKGADDKLVFRSDPSTLITIPADTDILSGSDFKFVSPDARINEMIADIENRLRRTAIRYKLPAEMFSVSGSKSSGFSIEMQNLQLSKAVKGDKPMYAHFENQLFNLMRLVWNYNNPGRKISDSAKVRIDYAELETPVSQAEEDAHFSVLLSNNIISRTRWAMEINPDLETVEKAKEYLALIDDERREEAERSISIMQSTMAGRVGTLVNDGNQVPSDNSELNNDEEDDDNANRVGDTGRSREPK
jgi:hypothetical protein